MEKSDREALAADIAMRVRLFCVQPLNREFVELLAPGRMWRFEVSPLIDHSKASQATTLTVDVTTDSRGAMTFVFMVNGQHIVQRVRFDPPDPEPVVES
jgi:hypothetical protein